MAVVGLPERAVGRVGERGCRGAASPEQERQRFRAAAVGQGSACVPPERPERIEFTDELPYNETGKLLRRKVRETLGESS